MRKHQYREVLSGAFLMTLCGLLAACRVTSSGLGQGEGTTIVRTPTQIARTTPATQPVSTPATQPVSTATATPGGVRLLLDKSAYAPGDNVQVTIENGLSVSIKVTDHHTDCTYVVLQQQQADSWQPIGLCKLMTPTRLVDLAAGSVTPQKIGAPTGPNAAGTYRVMLLYGASGTEGNEAYSSTFSVAQGAGQG
jgi:hypothetical protein